MPPRQGTQSPTRAQRQTAQMIRYFRVFRLQRSAFSFTLATSFTKYFRDSSCEGDHFEKTSLLFSNTSPLSAKTSLLFFPTRHSPPTPPLAADFLPRRCAYLSHARTRTRPHHRVSHFLPSPFTPPYKTLSTNNLQPQKRVNIRPKKPSHHLHQTTSRVSAHDRG